MTTVLEADIMDIADDDFVNLLAGIEFARSAGYAIIDRADRGERIDPDLIMNFASKLDDARRLLLGSRVPKLPQDTQD